MSKAELKAMELYPEKMAMNKKETGQYDKNYQRRKAFQEGYEQAEKEIIKRIREQIEKWIPDNPEGDEHLYGESVAFRSVLHLLKEIDND